MSTDKLVEVIEKLSDEEVQDIYKKLNPYSYVAPEITDDKLVSFSYTNMSENYMKRFMTTSMIAYLYRHLREWKTPEEIPSVSVEEYLANPACIEPYAYLREPGTNPTAQHAKDVMLKKYAEYKEVMKKKVIIHEFLGSLFDFNADEHVISALKVNNTDPKRKLPDTPAVHKAIETKNTVTNAARKSYETPTNVIDAKLPATDVFHHIPSEDMIARFDRYRTDNYEQLHDATYRLYGVRNDTDLAVIFYDKHASADEAKIFKERHANEFNVPVTRIKQNRWVLLGPYKKNREAVDWLSSSTDVLKEMLDKRGEDEKIMNDIMTKAAKRKKMKEIAEQGPDSEAVEKYFKDNQPAVSSLGAKQIQLTPEERQKAIDMYNARVKSKTTMSASTSTSSSSTSSITTVAASATSSAEPPEIKTSSMLPKSSATTATLTVSSTPSSTSAETGPVVVKAIPTAITSESTRKFIEAMDSECPKDLIEIPVISISNGGTDVAVKKIYNAAEAPIKITTQ